jgi:hypothetical protein
MSANLSDDSIYDRDGISHLFDQLVYSAEMLNWTFDKQIDGAPPELLDRWRYL